MDKSDLVINADACEYILYLYAEGRRECYKQQHNTEHFELFKTFHVTFKLCTLFRAKLNEVTKWNSNLFD